MTDSRGVDGFVQDCHVVPSRQNVDAARSNLVQNVGTGVVNHPQHVNVGASSRPQYVDAGVRSHHLNDRAGGVINPLQNSRVDAGVGGLAQNSLDCAVVSHVQNGSVSGHVRDGAGSSPNVRDGDDLLMSSQNDGGHGGSSLPSRSVPLQDLSSSQNADVPSFSVNDLKKAWRRECKIKGTIGKIGDKENKLTYVDVERQIKTHETNGYPDAEIIDAVINATQAGSTLRTLLQTTVDLNLETMKAFLHSYFLEVDGGDLVTQLTKAKQTSQQDPQTFLMHCISLKNRIVKQKEEEGGMSVRGATKIMLKTLESGISSERIVNRLMPLLSKENVTDAELISGMSKAVIANKDRDSKGDKEKEKEKDKKSVRIASVERKSEQDENMYQMIAEIRSDLRGMKNGNSGGKKEYGCESCCLVGKGRSCTHCFYCGDEGHKYDVCPKKKSLNSNRSSTRD